MIFSLKGVPTPLLRPRFASRGAVHVYDSQNDIATIHKLWLKFTYENETMLEGPLHLKVEFYMPIPNYSKKKRRSLHGVPHARRPYLSNLVKYIEYIGSKIIYADDSKIVQITASKVYDLNPRTVFTFEEIGNDKEESKEENKEKNCN